MMIQGDRLWNRLMELSHIGKQPSGGVIRLAFSEEERQAKNLVASYMREAGMQVREDAVGNLIGRREGNNPNAPVVLVGSHVDSVFHGGNFDGPLGVLAGVEAVQTMNEQGITTEHPIEVIAFTDEEGARFRSGMTGSKGLAGTLRREDLETAHDKDGISIAEAMCSTGFDPDAIAEAARTHSTVKAYVELHIEQGKVLENAGHGVGIVTGIAGPLWLKFTAIGETGHAGTTPMNLRKDALAAVAELMTFIEKRAAQEQRTVATVGQMFVHPGGVNIIPGCVEFTLDLRDVDEQIRNEVESAIRNEADAIAGRRGIHFEIEELQRVAPVLCADLVKDAVQIGCEQVGVSAPKLPSGAGHDGMQLAELCPIGMIFVRSRNGISHQPEEWSSPEDCTAGANVLLHTIIHLAK